MKHFFSKAAAFFTLAAVALWHTGCKENTIINADVAPSVDNVTTQQLPDTITILSTTVYDDTIVTSISSTSVPFYHGLGTANDPFFGRTNASIYFQVLPEKAGFTFSANSPTVDSAFVILPYAYFNWGDTAQSVTPQSFSVYRVTEDMSDDDIYYAFTNKAIDRANPISEPLLQNVSSTNLRDSVLVRGSNTPPHVRIRLKDAFVQELKNVAASSTDNSTFFSTIKGICVAPTDTNNTGGRTLSYFLMNGKTDYSRAAIQFFYHEGSNTNDVKTAFFNYVPGECAHYNRITRNYTNSLASAYINSTASSDSVILLQNEPGAAFDLRFPYLNSLPATVINKAQLIVTKVTLGNDPAGNIFYEPSRIFPIGVDGAGKLYTLLDLESTSNELLFDFVDGKRITTNLGGITLTQYVINMPREVQRAILNKSEILHLRINGTQTYPGAYRLTAGGSGSLFKVSLQISYSKL